MPSNGPPPPGPKPEPSPPPPPRKPPTGNGLIGQVGAKPGGSVAGSVLPPRPELTDPRLREPQREYSAKFYADSDAMIVWMGIGLFAACAVAGFVFGHFFGRTL